MDVSELTGSIDIVEYISQFIDLEQRGDEWWGLSCFRDEHTPSFSVRRDPPVFYDYSSGKSGGLLSFVKEYNHCSGWNAVEILKSYAGYDGELEPPKRELSATQVCKKFSPPKREKKQSSGIVLADDHMERYERRMDKLHVWEQEGISLESLDRFQVRYDAFADRLVYPIRNPDGKIVNVGGRILTPNWKEQGQRKYCYYYSWGTIETIYGVYENREAIQSAHEIILFEGCKSVLLADTWGIKNTGAILTSHLSKNQMKLLAKLGCHVVFALDKEVDIHNDHNINSLKRYVNVEYLRDDHDLLGEKDAPVDKGKEVFQTLYANRFRLR